MHPLLTIAVQAARRAGEVIARSIPRLEGIEIASKGRHDYVTEVDRAAEAEIIAIIRRHYPEHAILAEESGASGDNEVQWIIDPLDGTTNFVHGFPVFAVSIAAQVRGRLEVAAIYDPLRLELFTATRGAGAQLENWKARCWPPAFRFTRRSIWMPTSRCCAPSCHWWLACAVPAPRHSISPMSLPAGSMASGKWA
jgi:myo-inositol-1(or 4)-monophosphatase